MRASDDIHFFKSFEKKINKESISVILVAHVFEPRGILNRDQIQCSLTERFSVEEFNEIYQGIVNAGFFISQTFFNELDFINDYLQNPVRFKNCVVFNLARNGVGNNKKAILPAFCELVGLCYTSSSSFSCSLCRNKYYFSKFLEAHNIPVPKTWLQMQTGQWIDGSPTNDKIVIFKPCNESASQGITSNNIIKYSDQEIRKGDTSLVQEYISGYECEVPIIEIDHSLYTLPPVVIDLKDNPIMDENMSENYSYKFQDASSILHLDTILLIEKYAEKAFRLLDMGNYGRIDFRIDQNGVPYIFDVSTMPYTIKHSSFAFAFQKIGLEYSDIYSSIITATISNQTNKFIT
ncbi:MAG: ATP-grasp domain-containing protein [Lachnospiraceae bacterium]|nr:ATP-grasp domain-containing protein [Lachnospiraceae bacterium]